jgi:exosortase E/protease (VPEID-CTERM system)
VVPNFSSSESLEALVSRGGRAPGSVIGLPRLVVLAILFGVEALCFSVWLDNAALAGRAGFLPYFLAHWAAWTVRGVVGSAAIFLTFAYLKRKAVLIEISAEARRAPVRGGLVAAHVASMAAFGALAWFLYGDHLGPISGNLAAFVWLTTGTAGMAFAAFALVPPAVWLRLVRETGYLLVYAVAAVSAACVVGAYIRELWSPMGRVTFGLVQILLRPFVSGIVADPASMRLGTAKFAVEIAPQCSGFEGVGLILAFGVIWLCLFRRECRFPQAWLLLPAGVVTIFLLNAVRLAALILIGNAGAPQIALGGFHSQAGWMAFNCVALAFSVAATHVPWLTTAEAPASGSIASKPLTGVLTANPTAAYLLPFLSILAVGILTAAVSSGFEWLYPLRFLAAAGTLWAFRQEYAELDWRPRWFAVAIGVAVFAMWIGADSFLGAAAGNSMPTALAATSAPLRVSWIAFRILAGTVTVPIAEELAFRGYLLRRFISADFETLPLRSFTWLGLGVSSVAFGLLHGNLWLAGIVAGLFYAWALVRRGNIADAVVAHATTNALLAGYVLIFQRWHLW